MLLFLFLHSFSIPSCFDCSALSLAGGLRFYFVWASVFSLFFDWFTTRPPFSFFCFSFPVLFYLLFIHDQASVFTFPVLVSLYCFGCCLFAFICLFSKPYLVGSCRVFISLVVDILLGCWYCSSYFFLCF